MINEDLLNQLGRDIHKTAVEKGWWENSREEGEIFMLIVTELSEAVEADRESRYADIQGFLDQIINEDVEFKEAFDNYIKDTVGDELADAFIRALDYLYYRDEDIEVDFTDIPWSDNFASDVFFLTKVACQEDIRTLAGVLPSFAEHHDIDFLWHVQQKMKYNIMRSKKHGGKKY